MAKKSGNEKTFPVQIFIGTGLTGNLSEKEIFKSFSQYYKIMVPGNWLKKPGIQILENPDLPANNCQIFIKGEAFPEYAVYPGRIMIFEFGNSLKRKLTEDQIDFIEATVPLLENDAFWVKPGTFYAEACDFSPEESISAFISIIIQNHLSDFLSVQVVSKMISDLRKTDSNLVEEIKKHYEISFIHRLLQRLLQEKVPINNFKKILEKLNDLHLLQQDDFFYIKSKVRAAIGSQICDSYIMDNELHVMTLSEKLTNLIFSGIAIDNDEATVNLGNETEASIISLISNELATYSEKKYSVAIAVDYRIFDAFCNFTRRNGLYADIITEDEILSARMESDISVKCVNIISFEEKSEPNKEIRSFAKYLHNLQKLNKVKKYISAQNSKMIDKDDYSRIANPSAKDLEERVSLCDFIITNNHCAVGVSMQHLNGSYHREYFLRNSIPYIKMIAREKGIRIFESEYAHEVFCDKEYSKGFFELLESIVNEFRK